MQGRVLLDEKTHLAWSQLKKQRDFNRDVADKSDLVMQAIEAAPELDKAICISMGIKPQVPAAMQPPR